MIINKDNDWTFKNKDIAEDFENHVREQLPWYETVKEIIIFLIRSYANKNGLIYDIGCSTGNLARSLEKIIKSRGITWVGIDESEEMLSLCPKIGETVCTDAMTYDYKEYDAAVLFLTSMFFDTNKRKDFLKRLYEKKKENGILIIVDKFISEGNNYFSTVMNRFNILLKLNNGVDSRQILNKELSLSGIQIPLYYKELPGNPVEFFRIGDFRGYVI
jgi:tRNA (cmo5U34)-methyltransferase